MPFRHRKGNRRGAIELSITGIVVLIIAITVLGLILGFVRNYFKSVGERVEAPIKEIEETVKNQLAASGKTIALSPEDIDISKGQLKDIWIGTRNLFSADDSEKTSVCHRLEFSCLQPFTGQECVPGQPLPTFIGGLDANGEKPQSNWFTSILARLDIENLGFLVRQAKLKIPVNIKPDTYEMEARLYSSNPKAPCSENPGWDESPVDRLRFTLTVK
jgi:hypothetical protein